MSPARDFGVFVLATPSGVLESLFPALIFFGGVEKRSMSSVLFSSSSKIRFLSFFDFLIGFSGFSSAALFSSFVIAVAKSLSASFFTRLSSFFLGASSAAAIGVRVISVIGELRR